MICVALLPLELVGDLKQIPKGKILDQRKQMETYPTVTSTKAPYYLWTFTDGRRTGIDGVTNEG